MKKNTTDKTINIEPVNINNFNIQKKEISVNGKALPFCIGDTLKLTEADKFIKTIVAVTILEDGRVQYMLEWYDPESSNFSTEAVTLSELKLLQISNAKKVKGVIGF